LGVVWQEMLKRFPLIEVMGEPRRLRSNFVKGYESPLEGQGGEDSDEHAE